MNILIVEDDTAIREGVAEFLKENEYEVFCAEDGEKALEILKSKEIHLALLDIMLPKKNGIEVLKELRTFSELPVIMLTAVTDEETQVQTFDNLADDYICKPFSLILLLKRIEALLRARYKTENTWKYKDAMVDFSGYRATYLGKDAAVTPKEIKLLAVLLENAGQVVSRDQILDRIWGEEESPFDRVVDVYVKNLRKKLQLDCIITVKGVGYKLELRRLTLTGEAISWSCHKISISEQPAKEGCIQRCAQSRGLNMKKMKLFPKTFLYTFFMLLFITTSMHLMIYFFYPKVYLSRMQDQLEKKMETLQQEIKRNTAAEAGQIFSDFAKQNNVNVTVECAGSEVTYMGMDFQISLYTDADMVFDVSNLENAESIIVKNKTMEADDGIEIQVEVMASAMPVKEAVDMITFLLPFTFGAAILFSIVFSYLYSRRITRPIFHMLNVTNDMKNLKPEAAFHVQDEDEVGLLAEQINQVYEQLLATIRSLDEEKEHMLAVEKSKTVFLRSASHELKTPLSGLRILLENMQYNIGKYKDRDKYLAEAVAKVDELSGMVRDILDTSKVQDLQEEEKQKLYADGEIGAVLQEYTMQIADKKLEVSDSIPEDCMLFMSRNAFQKVWSNLIGNAVQYTEQGGQITIAADTDKIWIENSCTPLTEEQLAYIYEPFYRVDDTRAASGGNGLGLYVVRELLKKEGFRYVFEPVEDGMRFTIFL